MLKMSCQTSNKCQAYNTILNTSLSIMLPFPPVISVSDIVNKRKPSRIKSKSPNAFLIYRKAFLDQLSIKRYNLKMTEVSKLVSSHWKGETELVKDAYRKIAQEVEIELDEQRKKSVINRIVWKNSPRKRNKIRKSTKTQGNKSAATVSSNHENVNYRFVSDFPEAESASKSEEVISTSGSVNLCNSLENYQNSYVINYQEANEYLEFNQTYLTYLQLIEEFTNLNQLYEQPEYFENVDENFQNFY